MPTVCAIESARIMPIKQIIKIKRRRNAKIKKARDLLAFTCPITKNLIKPHSASRVIKRFISGEMSEYACRRLHIKCYIRHSLTNYEEKFEQIKSKLLHFGCSLNMANFITKVWARRIILIESQSIYMKYFSPNKVMDDELLSTQI